MRADSIVAADSIAPPDSIVVRPAARVETQPVPNGSVRDAADDPAIWIHPTDPSQSLLLVTDKQSGLVVYDLDGNEIQVASEDCRPDNVDVLYGFPLGGVPTDVAVAACRADSSRGVKVWAIDPAARRLTDVTAGGLIPVFGDSVEPYGTCVYHSARSGKFYFFVDSKLGEIQEYVLEDDGGKARGRCVRNLRVDSICEGCVADDERGDLYLAEERVGIWKFGAEPDAGDQRVLVARVGEHGLVPDVEGLTLYCARGGRGYLIASSQGNSTFKVYTREAGNRFVLTIDPSPGAIDDVEHTDGIDVTSCRTTERFPDGLFVVQDGQNDTGNQNCKLYGWEDIATNLLIADAPCGPRPQFGPWFAPVPLAAAGSPARREPGPRAAAAASLCSGSADDWTAAYGFLETRSARFPAPGTASAALGMQRSQGVEGDESAVPLVIRYIAAPRVAFLFEPVLYVDVDETSEARGAGPGDFELSAAVQLLAGTGLRPALALAAEAKLPTATNRVVGSGRADWGASLRVTQRVGPFDVHLNLEHTLTGKPHDAGMRDYSGFSAGLERPLGEFGIVAEIAGHTNLFAHGDDESHLGVKRIVGSESVGENLLFMLGGRWRCTETALLSLGLSYDEDGSVTVHPSVAVRFR